MAKGIGPGRLRQERKDVVHEADDEREHVSGYIKRHDYKEPGYKVMPYLLTHKEWASSLLTLFMELTIST